MNIKKRYTLIELLVVIAVIALLSTLLFSAMEVGIKRVRKTTCMNNLKQMGAGVALYTGDNKGMLPVTYQYYNDENGDIKSISVASSWKFQIGNYVYPKSGVDYIVHGNRYKGDDIVMCNTAFDLHEDLITKTFECPQAPYYTSSNGETTYEDFDEFRRGGYGWSSSLINEVTIEGKNYARALHSTKVSIPSETTMIGDSLVTDVSSTFPHTFNRPTHGFMTGTLYMVHDDGINVLWADNHVSWASDEYLRSGPKPNTSLATRPRPNTGLAVDYYFDYFK